MHGHGSSNLGGGTILSKCELNRAGQNRDEVENEMSQSPTTSRKTSALGGTHLGGGIWGVELKAWDFNPCPKEERWRRRGAELIAPPARASGLQGGGN